MGVIKNFGFELYRLKQAQDNCELLIFDIDNKKNYQYSFRRGTEMLKMEMEKINNSTLLTFMKNNGYLDSESKTVECMALFKEWILEDIKLIDNINYKPINEKIFEENGYIYFNTYQQPKLFSEDLSKVDCDFNKIKTIILNLVGNDEQGYEYFIKWLAWQIQNPLERLATSIVFQGQQGSGKTLFCNYVLKPIFESNFTEVGQSDITGDYSEFIMGKQIIVANEVIYNEKRHISSEKLKNFVSDDFVNIKRKYKDNLYIRNYSQWIFTSNSQVPIKIEKNDRRFTVFKSKKLVNGVEFFLDFQKVMQEEVKAFYKHLTEVEVKLADVNYPYINNAKKDIIEASLNNVELFFEAIYESGGIDQLNKEYEDLQDGWHNHLYFINTKNNNYLKLDCLYKLYQKFCIYAGYKQPFGRNGFTSQLKHLNFKITIVKDDEGKSQRVLSLESIEQ